MFVFCFGAGNVHIDDDKMVSINKFSVHNKRIGCIAEEQISLQIQINQFFPVQQQQADDFVCCLWSLDTSFSPLNTTSYIL